MDLHSVFQIKRIRQTRGQRHGHCELTGLTRALAAIHENGQESRLRFGGTKAGHFECNYCQIASKPFLNFVSELSGIPDLLLDPAMFGGGKHENLDGQELDPHLDFNYDESEQLHRRLDLIVYLNKGWNSARSFSAKSRRKSCR